MVKVPVAPQVQPQVQQEQVAAPQFQAAPSPGMQSVMQLGQDLARAGQMAIGIEQDKNRLAEMRARIGAQSRISAQDRQDRQIDADVRGVLSSVSDKIDLISDEYQETLLGNALDRTSFDTRVQQAIEEGSAALPQGVARDAYTQKAQSYYATYNRNARKHQIAQQRAYETASDEAEIKSLANMAARSFSSVSEPSGDFNVALGSMLRLVETSHARLGLAVDDPIVQEKKRSVVQGIVSKTSALLMNDGRYDEAIDHVQSLRDNDLLDEASAEVFLSQARSEKDQSEALSDAAQLASTGRFGGSVSRESIGKLVSAQGVDVVGTGSAPNGRTIILAGPVDGETPGDTAERLRAVGLTVHYAVQDDDLVKLTVSASPDVRAFREGSTKVPRLDDGSLDVSSAKKAINASGRSDEYKKAAVAEIERVNNEEARRRLEQESARNRAAKSIAHSAEAQQQGRSLAHLIPRREWLQLSSDVRAALSEPPPALEGRTERDALYAMSVDRSKSSAEKMQFLDNMSPRLSESTYNKYRDIFGEEGTGKANLIYDRDNNFKTLLYRNGFEEMANVTLSSNPDLYSLKSILFGEWTDAINTANAGRAARDEKPLTPDQEKEIFLGILGQKISFGFERTTYGIGTGAPGVTDIGAFAVSGLSGVTKEQFMSQPRMVRFTNQDGSVTQQEVPPTDYQLAEEMVLRDGLQLTNENIGVAIQMMRQGSSMQGPLPSGATLDTTGSND